MKAKLIINGKELEVDVSDEEIEKLTTKNKTGYERVSVGSKYYSINLNNEVCEIIEDDDYLDRNYYNTANYYSDGVVAENNARADEFLRQIRRFAVEHRKDKIDWDNTNQSKYYIYYNYKDKRIYSGDIITVRDFSQIYFDTEETARLAIDTFKDELLWYFTEYKDNL